MTHLDEGTIHAWLDGALGADDAAEVERHIGACDACSARVAEARGLLAGASRILSALDDVGGEIVPLRTPEVRRTRTGPKVTRVVAWLAAAGLLLAVGLETRAKVGPESTPARVTFIEPSPVRIADSQPVGQSASETVGRSENRTVEQSGNRTAAGKPAAATVEAAKVAAAPGARFGRIPTCFENLPAGLAAEPVAADARRSEAKATVGAMRAHADAAPAMGGNQVRQQLASTVLMLDTTPVSPTDTGARAPRVVRDAGGVAGEWQLLRPMGEGGGDSVQLRLGQPPVQAMRAAVTPAGLKVGARVMGRVACGPVER